MNILSPVEKLIYYRKMYKISQEELVRDSIARSYLAMIESKRKKLNNKIAKILVENFNNILKEKEINFSLSLDYLLEEKETQITQITETLLTKLNNQNVDSIAFEAEKLFLEEESKENKKRLYLKIGNIYYENETYKRANVFFYDILGDLLKSKENMLFEELVIKILKGNLKLGAYKDNILFKNKIEKFIDNFSKKSKEDCLYYIAVSTLKTENCDKTFQIFKKLEKSSGLEKIFELKMLQAECCIKLKKYEEAASIYRGALLKFKDQSKKFIVNYNLLKLAKSQNDEEKISFYLKKLLILKENTNIQEIENSNEILFEIGISSKNLEKRKKALNCFLEIINCSNNLKLKFEAISHAMDLFKRQEIKQVQELEDAFFNLLKECEGYRIGYKFINFYSKNDLNKFEENFKNRIVSFI